MNVGIFFAECVMKAIIQRVKRAKVTVENKVIGEIDKGFLVLLGVTHTDTKEQVEWIAHKIANLRIFSDEEGKMNLSVKDVGGKVLIVSNFTLYGDAKKGFRPSYIDAARPEIAEPLYTAVCNEISEKHCIVVETGQFSAMMDVELVNDGPVTIIIEK